MTTGNCRPLLVPVETNRANFDWQSVFQSRSFSLLGYAVGLILLLNQAVMSTGFVLDDEISHFWYSYSSWDDPLLLFGTWTRPGRNLFHFPVSFAGLTATRIYTICALLLATAMTCGLGKDLKLKQIAWIPLLLLAQPWVVQIGSHVLTQTPFLLFWIAAIYFHQRKQYLLAGFCFGYLPLVRHEGLALTVCYAAYCLWNKQWRGVVLIALPIVGVNLAAWYFRQPLPFSVYSDAKPTEIYGSGPLWHFALPTVFSVGLPIMSLCVCGLTRGVRLLRDCPLLLTFPVYFAMHSVIYWQGLFASGGYVFFLMPMAPFFALLAAAGIEQIRQWARPDLGGPVQIVLCISIIAVGWCLPLRAFGSPHTHGFTDQLQWMLSGCPTRRDKMKDHLDAAIAWVEAHPEYSTEYLKTSHPYVSMRLNYPYSYRHWKHSRNLLQAPEEVLVIWDERYTPTQRSLENADFDAAGWQQLAKFGDGAVVIYTNKQLLNQPVKQ